MRGFTIASVIVLVIVVGVVGTAAVLLARTVQEAQTINAKAQNIATTGRGINMATDSVIQLTRTNKLARSILKTAKPLDMQLGGIVNTAQGIDALASSINSSAGSINSTARSVNDSAETINSRAGSINNSAGEINASAGSINTSAGRINASAGSINTSAGRINRSAGSVNRSVGSINDSANRIDSLASSILGTAQKVDRDVRLINRNLDVTLSLAVAVQGDTSNIVGQAVGANDTAACIARKLYGPGGDFEDCQGRATPASLRGGTVVPRRLQSPESLEQRRPEAGGAPPPAGEAPAVPEPGPGPGSQLPLPEAPELPTGPLENLIDEVLPGLGQGDRPGGSPGNLLDQLLPGLGQ